ncbi:MAG: helix-turn-helix transcriptional regulator [Clostridia bacterium]|nr:helix-turn-helix transcriptional regulator [Clostridia bacterium]
MSNFTPVTLSDNKDYQYYHRHDEVPEMSHYQIHTHNSYELLIFIKGDASFVVEGAVFPLAPYDVLITRPGEMHQIFHHSPAPYERIMLRVTDAFFVNNDCTDFRHIFTEREAGRENILRLGSKNNTAILDTIKRIEKYAQKEQKNEVVIRCAVIELLYALNQLKPAKAVSTPQSEIIGHVTSYISHHLDSDLTLEALAEQFFVSKYYLCRIFKKYTGITLGQYITQKRILAAKSFYQGGHSLSESASLAGFSDYSSFYKACTKETGQPPRKALSL